MTTSNSDHPPDTLASRTALTAGIKAHHDRFGNKTWIDRRTGEYTTQRRTPQTPRKDRPRCGARTRQGNPCQATPIWDEAQNRPRNGRCRNHGGLSTGARTPEGKARADEALRRGRETRRLRAAGPSRPPRQITCRQCRHFGFLEQRVCLLAKKPWRHWKPGTTEFYSADDSHSCADYRHATRLPSATGQRY